MERSWPSREDQRTLCELRESQRALEARREEFGSCLLPAPERIPTPRARRLKPRATPEINGGSGCAAVEAEFQKKFSLLGDLFGVQHAKHPRVVFG